MANTVRQPIDAPKVYFRGTRRNLDNSTTSMSGDSVFNTTDISTENATVEIATNDTYIMIGGYVKVYMELGNYPDNLTLVDYTGQANSPFHKVGLKTEGLTVGQANILYRLDGKMPSANEGMVYYDNFVISLPGAYEKVVGEDLFIVGNGQEIELTAITLYGGEISTMQRVIFRITR